MAKQRLRTERKVINKQRTRKSRCHADFACPPYDFNPPIVTSLYFVTISHGQDELCLQTISEEMIEGNNSLEKTSLTAQCVPPSPQDSPISGREAHMPWQLASDDMLSPLPVQGHDQVSCDSGAKSHRTSLPVRTNPIPSYNL